MKNIIAGALLAVTAFFAQSVEASDPRWAYVYTDDHQVLFPQGSTAGGSAVNWGGYNGDYIHGIFSEGIWVDQDDPTTIIIKHPGIYAITYSSTLHVSEDYVTDDGDAQLALYLNNYLVPESIYAVGNAFDDDLFYALDEVLYEYDEDFIFDLEDGQTQLNGQLILVVRDHFSRLNLVNQCENTLLLSHTAGTDDPETYGHNISASILINRLEKVHSHE